MNKKVALILSGCGHKDGTEITEAVSLNLCLLQAGFAVDYFAPNRAQADTVNHLNGQAQQGERNILVESARIARGQIKALEALNVAEYEAIVLPGGFGAVKNFTDFLSSGGEAKLQMDIGRVLSEALTKQKALVAICAAPLVLALAIKEAGQTGAQITFGLRSECEDFLEAIEAWGVVHIERKIDECLVDPQYRLVTAAAYMYGDATAVEVFSSAQAAVKGLEQLLG